MEIQIGDSNHIFEIAIEIWISKLDLHHLTTDFVIWRHIKVHGAIWFCWSYIKGHHITISAEELIIFPSSLIYRCKCSCPFQKIVKEYEDFHRFLFGILFISYIVSPWCLHFVFLLNLNRFSWKSHGKRCPGPIPSQNHAKSTK